MYIYIYIWAYMGLFFMGLWDLQDGKPKDHFQDERNIVTGWIIFPFSWEFHHPN